MGKKPLPSQSLPISQVSNEKQVSKHMSNSEKYCGESENRAKDAGGDGEGVYQSMGSLNDTGARPEGAESLRLSNPQEEHLRQRER